MTPGWGRKKCSRRTCPPSLCMPMPRPCLDSLRIPTRSCALHRTPRTEFVPRCDQISCGAKHTICHCAEKNYCTAQTCTNLTSCIHAQNILNRAGFKGDKDKNIFCKGPCREQDDWENNDVEDYEKENETACNEASCEKLENCGVGSTSNNEELNNPVTYTPSLTNQSSLTRTPPIELSNQVPFNDNSARKISNITDPSLSIVGFGSKSMTPKSNKFTEVNMFPNINRCIQVNIQHETISGRGRDADSSVAPEACCDRNNCCNSLNLSGSSQRKLSNVDNTSGPVQNIKSSFESVERYDTNAQPYIQSSKTSESHLNSQVSNIQNNGGYLRDNVISLTDGNNSPNKPNPFQPKSQDLASNNTENEEFGNVYQRTRKMSQQNIKLFPEQYEKHAERNNKSSTPMQSALQRSPEINKDRLGIPDNYQHILPRENVLSNSIPSSTKAPYVNATNSNELAKISLSGNNFPNERRLFNEGKNQFMISASNDCCRSGNAQRYLDSPESSGQKASQLMSSTVANNQPLRSYTKPPLTNNTAQVKFDDKNYINNAPYSSPYENQNTKYNMHPQPPEMQINYNRSKEFNNRIQPTNSASNEIVDNFVGGKMDCVCSDEIGPWTNSKHNQKNKRKFKTHDLQDTRCKKKPSCFIEDGTTSCASMTCVVNQNVGCSCKYPPAFKQFCCTGNLSGSCNCNEKQ